MLTIETQEQGVKYFTPCSTAFIVNFEHVIAGWVECREWNKVRNK